MPFDAGHLRRLESRPRGAKAPPSPLPCPATGATVAPMRGATAIVGYGRFGRALGGLLEEAGLPFCAFDPAADVPAPHRAGSIEEALAGAELVLIAVPVPSVREALRAVRPHVEPGALVADVASVKVAPAAAMREVLGADVPWVATHPLFGPTSLALGERPLHVVVCPSPIHPGAAARARAFYERIGCRVVEQNEDEHDRAMAETHALTFFVAKGLLDVGAGEGAAFTPPSFQAIARTIEVVRSDAGHLFAAIHRENPHAPAARRRLLDALAAIDASLSAPDAPPAESTAEEEPALSIPGLGEQSPELRATRELIDEVDREIVALLARRAHLARRAGRAKARAGQAIRDHGREAALLEARRAWGADAGLDPSAIDDVFGAILRLSRGVQARLASEDASETDAAERGTAAGARDAEPPKRRDG